MGLVPLNSGKSHPSQVSPTKNRLVPPIKDGPINSERDGLSIPLNLVDKKLQTLNIFTCLFHNEDKIFVDWFWNFILESGIIYFVDMIFTVHFLVYILIMKEITLVKFIFNKIIIWDISAWWPVWPELLMFAVTWQSCNCPGCSNTPPSRLHSPTLPSYTLLSLQYLKLRHIFGTPGAIYHPR